MWKYLVCFVVTVFILLVFFGLITGMFEYVAQEVHYLIQEEIRLYKITKDVNENDGKDAE